MRKGGKVTSQALGWVNSGVLRLRSSPRFGKSLRRRITIVTYTGRRSGRTFSFPVAYQRENDLVTINVGLPDAKNWWRNFTPPGARITVELDEVTRQGHAIAHRDEKGNVTVEVRLEQ